MITKMRTCKENPCHGDQPRRTFFHNLLPHHQWLCYHARHAVRRMPTPIQLSLPWRGRNNSRPTAEEDAPETRSFSSMLGLSPNVMDYRVGNITSTDVPDVPVTPSQLRLSDKLPARAATSPSSGPSVEYEENKSSPYAKSKKRTTFKEARMETQAISDFQAQLRASYGPSGSSAAQDSKAAQKSTIKVGRIAAGSTGAAAQLPPPVPLPAPGSFENEAQQGLIPRSISFEGLDTDTTSSTTVNERLPPPGSPTLMLHTPLSTAGSPARGTAEELGDDLEALLSRASEQSDGAHTCT